MTDCKINNNMTNLLPPATIVAGRQCFHKCVSRILSTGVGVYPGGVCLSRVCQDPRGSASWGRAVCIQGSAWGYAFRGSASKGESTSRGVCLRGLCTWGLHPRGSASRDLHPGGRVDPRYIRSYGIQSMRQYASYWNAFLYKL